MSIHDRCGLRLLRARLDLSICEKAAQAAKGTDNEGKAYLAYHAAYTEVRTARNVAESVKRYPPLT